jgi:Putative zinc-finger
MLHMHVKRLLSAYLDKALERNTAVEMEVHLKTCDQCAEALAEIQSGAAFAAVARDEIVLDKARHVRLKNLIKPVRPSRFLLRITGAALALIIAITRYFFVTRQTTSRTALAGALPLDLLVQEAASLTPAPEWDTEPYAKLARTKLELEGFTGQVFSEPQLPERFSFVRGFIYHAKYGGAIGRIYASSDGHQVIALFEQPRETPMAYPPRNPRDSTFLGKKCIEVRWPTLRLFSWVTGPRRTLLLTNMSTTELQPLFTEYPGLRD